MNFEDLKKEVLNDAATRKEYEAMEGEYQAKVAVYNARKAAGFSQEALAEVSGVPRVTIARIEAGTTNTSVATLSKIAQSLGKSVNISIA